MAADLSIVVVSYNTRQMTEQCLASVLDNCGDLRIQLIVVDNDSRDDSADMLQERFPRVTLIRNQQNRGFAAANNQGFRIAQGKYVLLLNSDTIILGSVLQNSVAYMEAHPEVGAFGCRVLNTDLTMQPSCFGYPTVGRLLSATLGLDRIPKCSWFDSYMMWHWQRDSERDVDTIQGCYLLVPRRVIDAIGGMDEQFFFFGEETDWCLRIRKAGWAVRFAPVGEIVHHHGASVRKLNHKRDVMLTASMVRLHRKNGGLWPAICSCAVLAAFNGSRAVAWSVLWLLNRASSEKAAYFWRVVANTTATWPRV